ncbi:hypothetical protein DY000_02040741 [Brassica cretica]|uniref:Uncharacterized protein n=1 Tax=Brassica cretica TaxID=69181 RepID=A0ABQ7BFN7_BRACR|nr:hypothetical protein DY000_02040741 [Brassica cretica]
MNPELLMFPSPLVDGRPRPCRPFTNPFSSHVFSWGDVPKADSEAVPMAPLRTRRSCFFDDGPRSETREGDMANMRRKYAFHPSVGMSSPTEFERAPNGGAGEVAVYEAYLEAGFRGAIPSLLGEISYFFGFCPSQLTPLTWATLMAIQRGSITFDPVLEQPNLAVKSCSNLDRTKYRVSHGNRHVSKPATDKLEYGNRTTDKQSSVATQQPTSSQARSLCSDRAGVWLSRYVKTEIEPSSVAT